MRRTRHFTQALAVVALLLGAGFPWAAPARAQALWPDITLALVADGFSLPVHITSADDGSGRLFVVEKAGRIQIIKDGQKLSTPFLDINDRVGFGCNECGLLSIAFPPNYAQAGYFFVYYTTKTSVIDPDQSDEPNGDHDTVVARFRVSSNNADRADAASQSVILRQNQPAENHNGGQLAFGPDGMLYIGLGDGGGGGDTYENGQDRSTWLGKILRIQVGPSGDYSVPDDNPFVGQNDIKPEIWAYGLRNPWRFSFDSATGDLYIGDVGQGLYEEIDRQPADSGGGENYGWNVMEGFHCYNSNTCDKDAYVQPIVEYGHSDGDCSVTGGVVHHSTTPGQAPIYLYGDYCSGRIRALQSAGTQVATTLLLDTEARITSFGQDEAGTTYVVDYNGSIYRMVEAPRFIQLLPLLRQD